MLIFTGFLQEVILNTLPTQLDGKRNCEYTIKCNHSPFKCIWCWNCLLLLHGIIKKIIYDKNIYLPTNLYTRNYHYPCSNPEENKMKFVPFLRMYLDDILTVIILVGLVLLVFYLVFIG